MRVLSTNPNIRERKRGNPKTPPASLSVWGKQRIVNDSIPLQYAAIRLLFMAARDHAAHGGLDVLQTSTLHAGARAASLGGNRTNSTSAMDFVR
jgi:hypothetical protein